MCLQGLQRVSLFSSLLSQLPTQQCSLQATATPQCEGKDHKNYIPASERPWMHRLPNKAESRGCFWRFFTLNHNGFKAKLYEGHPLWVAALALTSLLPPLWMSVRAYNASGWLREQLNMVTAFRVQMSGCISDSVLNSSQPEDRRCSVHLLPYLGSFLPRTFSTSCDAMPLSVTNLYRKRDREREMIVLALCLCVT